MLFNSFEYIFIFLPLSIFIFYLLIFNFNKNIGIIWLLTCSLIFFSYSNISFVIILFISVAINYICTRLIFKFTLFKIKSSIFIFCLIFNLGILLYYKYFNFLIENLNFIGNFGLQTKSIVFPLAISFYTIQQIAYLVDSYLSKKNQNSFLNYFLFVSFFPQLIAGPIVKQTEIFPQFNNIDKNFLNYNNISLGIFIFSIGLFKKIILADNLAILVSSCFDTASPTFIQSWLGTVSFSFQLYFDFSGYTDMAFGSAIMLGIKLPKNFNSPYKSSSIIDFWQNWHITLTRFIFGYIYYPILKLFKNINFVRAMIVTLITFFIAGLWHGPSWNYVIFGIINGLALIFNHIWRKINFKYIKFNNFFNVLLTFLTVNFSFVFFRAENLPQAKNVIKGMLNIESFSLKSETINNISDIKSYLIFILSIIIIFILKNSDYYKSVFKCDYKTLFFTISLFTLSIINLNSNDVFIYFKF